MVILATTWYSEGVDLGVRYAKYEIPRTLASRTRRTGQFVEDEGVAHRAALLSDKTWQSGEGGTKRQRAQLTSSNNLLCPSPVGRLRREDAMRSEIAHCMLDLRSTNNAPQWHIATSATTCHLLVPLIHTVQSAPARVSERDHSDGSKIDYAPFLRTVRAIERPIEMAARWGLVPKLCAMPR